MAVITQGLCVYLFGFLGLLQQLLLRGLVSLMPMMRFNFFPLILFPLLQSLQRSCRFRSCRSPDRLSLWNNLTFEVMGNWITLNVKEHFTSVVNKDLCLFLLPLDSPLLCSCLLLWRRLWLFVRLCYQCSAFPLGVLLLVIGNWLVILVDAEVRVYLVLSFDFLPLEKKK